MVYRSLQHILTEFGSYRNNLSCDASMYYVIKYVFKDPTSVNNITSCQVPPVWEPTVSVC